MHRSNSKCYSTISSAQSNSEDGTVRSSALATISNCEAIVLETSSASALRGAAESVHFIICRYRFSRGVIAVRGINPPAAGLANARVTARIPA